MGLTAKVKSVTITFLLLPIILQCPVNNRLNNRLNLLPVQDITVVSSDIQEPYPVWRSIFSTITNNLTPLITRSGCSQQDRILRELLSTDPASVLIERLSNQSFLFVDTITIRQTLTTNDFTDAGIRSLIVDNAGGKSAVSEALSIDYFVRMYGAKQVLVEKEVPYWIEYKMVDFLCSIGQHRVGVSVTRAMAVQDSGRQIDVDPDAFTIDHARRLLRKKLYGLVVSRNGVARACRFFKSILHIWVPTQHIAKMINQAWNELDLTVFDLDIKGVVIVVITVCAHESLYLNTYHHTLTEEARRLYPNGLSSTESLPDLVDEDVIDTTETDSSEEDEIGFSWLEDQARRLQ